MPTTRPPRELWRALRRIVWHRDGRRCTRCRCSVTSIGAHIDNVLSGRLGRNRVKDLRTLCRRCHVLRADPRHRGLIGGALRDGIDPSDLGALTWEG